MNKLWVFVVVVIVAVVGVWWYQHGGSNGQFSLPSFMPSAGYLSPSPAAKTSSYRKAPAPTSAYSYTDLVQMYGNNRIQIDRSCQVMPSTMAVKNGTSIMLDNRSNSAKAVSLNGKVYNLAAYGYQVVTLQAPSVPQNISISCNTSVNVGTIMLEAKISQ